MIKSLFLSLITTPLVLAAPFQPKTIPAEAQWYLHGDLTGIRETKTGEAILKQLRVDESDKIADIEALFGFDILNDLTDVTLFGTGKMDQIAITLAGGFDRARLEEIIGQADLYESTTHGETIIHQWDDNGSTQHAAFQNDTTVTISPQKALVELALDVHSQKKPGLNPDLKLPTDNPVVVAFANVQKIDLPSDEGSKIVRKADSIFLTLSEKEERLSADMIVKANSDKMASRMMHILEGLVSLGQLADENIEALDIRHQGQSNGKTMTMSMSLPATKALALLSELK